MDLLQKTLKICQDNNIKPARSRGQNFLINENVYDDIIETANLNKDDVVLEIGPGLGFLTEKLAQKVKKVIAIELDNKLASYLQKRFTQEKIYNIEIINKNILDVYDIGFKNYKIVANLPYNISSVFLRKFLEADVKPQAMTLMLQKEVVERIIAKPGKMSLLALSVQFYAKAQIKQYVSRNDFWPSPAVDSAIIFIKIIKEPTISVQDKKKFFRLLRHSFSSKRKMLKNNLSAGLQISQAEIEDKLIKTGLNPKIRAQDLSLKDWEKLLSEF